MSGRAPLVPHRANQETTGQSYFRGVSEWVCGCCGRWRVSVELIRGRHRYRLVRRYPRQFGGGKDVLGEVGSVAELEELLRRRTPLGLADLREAV
ncbi:hypothetical protein GA0070608_0271 [Micromonospora peucetia]|uniref:Uncharacterized protein n=1 Tax=Micromonospora peucetia TaxID=47871 RepID=A0A1C6U1J4_9ACTN|nr:hypothetical protein GA0070608_0271 [Micromonospora peucetia]